MIFFCFSSQSWIQTCPIFFFHQFWIHTPTQVDLVKSFPTRIWSRKLASIELSITQHYRSGVSSTPDGLSHFVRPLLREANSQSRRLFTSDGDRVDPCLTLQATHFANRKVLNVCIIPHSLHFVSHLFIVLLFAIRGASICKSCDSLISDCRVWILVAL